MTPPSYWTMARANPSGATGHEDAVGAAADAGPARSAAASTDAAEAANANYNVQTGMIEMSGDVLLVQGTSALTAERMFVDTKAGTARMSGRVKTVLQPEGQQ